MSGQQKITYQLRKSKGKSYGPTKVSAVKETKPKRNLPQARPDKQNNEIDELKHFDLESKFGPAIGMTRLERWNRAFELDLNPPDHIKDLINSHMDDPEYAKPLWNSHSLIS